MAKVKSTSADVTVVCRMRLRCYFDRLLTSEDAAATVARNDESFDVGDEERLSIEAVEKVELIG